jgi:DNA replication and repair protein RecF
VHVTALSVTDFRSYHQADVELGPGVTAFLGRNGQGKTNLVEALVYLSTLASHRVATDAPLVRAGAQRAVVRAEVARGGRSLLLEVEINPGRANRARINRAPVPRPRELLGGLRTVLFAPEDLALVKGDPAERRRFLDDLLVARSPRFAGVRADYDRVVKQRNALLKSAVSARRGGGDGDVARTLEVWDAHLGGLGAELLDARLRLVSDLAAPVAAAYTAVAPAGGSARLEYVAPWAPEGPLPEGRDTLEAAIHAAIERRRREESDRGVTLVGPHRDDVLLSLGDLPAKGYASHGESWSLALGLRLASYDLLRGDTDPEGEPVLLLDDVFAELDADRRERLAARVVAAEQVLVTAAVPADVPDALAGARVDVADGAAVRRG